MVLWKFIDFLSGILVVCFCFFFLARPHSSLLTLILKMLTMLTNPFYSRVKRERLLNSMKIAAESFPMHKSQESLLAFY